MLFEWLRNHIIFLCLETLKWHFISFNFFQLLISVTSWLIWNWSSVFFFSFKHLLFSYFKCELVIILSMFSFLLNFKVLPFAIQFFFFANVHTNFFTIALEASRLLLCVWPIKLSILDGISQVQKYGDYREILKPFEYKRPIFWHLTNWVHRLSISSDCWPPSGTHCPAFESVHLEIFPLCVFAKLPVWWSLFPFHPWCKCSFDFLPTVMTKTLSDIL